MKDLHACFSYHNEYVFKIFANLIGEDSLFDMHFCFILFSCEAENFKMFTSLCVTLFPSFLLLLKS